MGRALLVLSNEQVRAKALHWIKKAPEGTRVTFQGPQRSLDANDKLWACLTDISEQVKYHGLSLKPEDFKAIFMDALRRECRMVPNIDNNGFVSLERSSSKLSKQEFSELLEIVLAWGAKEGVVFHDPREG